MGQEGTPATSATHLNPGGDSATITRRTLLGGTVAAGAASLIAPAAGLAESFASRRPVSSRWAGSLAGQSPVIQAPVPFGLVGVQWSGPAGARIELRAQAPNGRWSHWVNASVSGHDGDGQASVTPLFGEPVWTGVAERVQLRSDRAVEGLWLHFVSVMGHSGAHLSAALPRAQPVLDAGSGQPPIIARAGWAGSQARPQHGPTYGTVKLAFVHHTETPNGYSAAQVPAVLRSIYEYHVYVRGFWDIAYNFLIDSYGRVWEGRGGGIDMAVIGAHAGAYNTESTGVAVLGSFMNVLPSRIAIGALEQLLAWKLSLHGVPSYGRVTVVVDPAGAAYTPFPPGAHVSLPRVAGHRDGDSTNCPGNAFYHDLPAIRPRITSLAGTPAELTIASPSAAVAPGAQATFSGQLVSLSGQPLAGAPLEIQVPGNQGLPATTIATTQTASDGSWSFSLSPQRNTLVRALHRAYPAAVSDWAAQAVAPILNLALLSRSPLVLTGTVFPPKRRVTVYLYRGSKPIGRPVRKRRVKVLQGRFRAHLRKPRPGTYTAIVRCPADATTVAGHSLAVTVTVS